MSIVEEIKDKIEYNGVIFERDILNLGYTKDDIENALEPNVFEEVENKWLPGKVYTFVEYSDFLDDYVRIRMTLYDIIRYYTGINQKYGMLIGFCSLNELGASDQVCGSYELKSILTSEKVVYKDDKTGCTITVYPMDIENYTSEIYWYYLYADAFNNYLDYFDNSTKYVLSKLKRSGLITNWCRLRDMVSNENIRGEIDEIIARE